MNSLVVIIGDDVAGSLEKLSNGRLQFTYDEEYQRTPGATPLSLSMPLGVRQHADENRRRPVTNFLWGLLPDNDRVLERWGRHFQVSPSSAFDLLGTPVGEDCAGGVAFCPPERADDHLSRPGAVTWLSDAEVSSMLRDLKQDDAAWLGRTFTGQFSLAGAQAKTALLHVDGRWGIPSGRTPTTHILKPAVTGFDDHDLNEYICLDAAQRAGLVAANSSIVDFEGQSALALVRYDRVVRGDAVHRVHQEDLLQALALPPSAKYQNQGGPSPSDVVSLFRRVMSPTAATDAVERFVDALIWNWLIGGPDAHAKNYSLLISGPDVRLAPLYDIASALPYGIHEKKLRMAMKLGGEYDVYPYRNFWPDAASELGIAADHVLDRVRHLAALVPDSFAEAANDQAIRSLGRDTTSKLVSAVAGRAQRCALLVR